MKAMPLRSSSGAICSTTSSRLRQPTASQGLDGTNWKWSKALITVILCSLDSISRISNAAGMPPMPAPRMTMWAMVISSSGDLMRFAEPDGPADQLVHAADHAHVEAVVGQYLTELRLADRADGGHEIDAMAFLHLLQCLHPGQRA